MAATRIGSTLMIKSSALSPVSLLKTPTSNFSTQSCINKSHQSNLLTNLSQSPQIANTLQCQLIGIRCASKKPPGGFFSRLYESIKDEMQQSREVKSSIQKFKEETAKLDESDALRNARRKYEALEEETSQKSKILKEKISDVSDKFKEGMDDVMKSEVGKQTSEIVGSVGRSVKSAGETISKGGKIIVESEAFRTVAEASETVRQHIDEELARARVYSSPKVLKRRSEFQMFASKTEFDPESQDINETEFRVELHKDVKWHERWEHFKDNNPMMNRMFDLRNQYSESDNPVVAGTRFVGEKITRFVGSFFTPNATSQIMSEIRKVDPTFSVIRFNDVCHKIIMPHVVEALFHNKMAVLEDWLTIPAYNRVNAQIEPLIKLGYHFDSLIMDVGEPDVLQAVMEEGNSQPILISQFEVQAVCIIRDRLGKAITLPDDTALIGGGEEGTVDKYHWIVALTRDMEDIDPISSWRVGDVMISRAKMVF